MSFTDEERRAWHEEKRRREMKPQTTSRPIAVTECIHCGQPFGYGEGFISDEISLCDICDDD